MSFKLRFCWCIAIFVQIVTFGHPNSKILPINDHLVWPLPLTKAVLEYQPAKLNWKHAYSQLSKCRFNLKKYFMDHWAQWWFSKGIWCRWTKQRKIHFSFSAICNFVFHLKPINGSCKTCQTIVSPGTELPLCHYSLIGVLGFVFGHLPVVPVQWWGPQIGQLYWDLSLGGPLTGHR